MATSIFRCVGGRAALVFSRATRAFGSSHISHMNMGVVNKSVIPPQASIPTPIREGPLATTTKVIQKRPPNHLISAAKNTNPPPEQQPIQPKSTNSISGLPNSGWVIIRNIPPMSSLTDIVQSINEVMDVQAETGIVDLDAAWKGGGQVSMLELDSTQDWVRSAHIVLSSHGRPNGWRIEFHNRSMAHAFLEYCRQHPFHCAWKPAFVEQWQKRSGNTEPLDISDSMVRVENAGDDVTADHVRHLFRRYDMATQGPSVRVFNEESSHKVFLVHFADPSWARAAVRELQGVRVNGNFLRLAQYPSQLVSSDN